MRPQLVIIKIMSVMTRADMEFANGKKKQIWS